MKHLVIISLLVFFTVNLFSQNKTLRPSIRKFKNDTIIRKQDSLLRPTDFKARPKPNGPLGLTAKALFVKSKSYITKSSEYVLRHEQLHFDICELNARKLRKKLIETDFKKVKKLTGEIQKQFNNSMSQIHKEQEKYDKETEHGLNSAKQAIWNESIQKQIKELDDYKSSAIDIAN